MQWEVWEKSIKCSNLSSFLSFFVKVFADLFNLLYTKYIAFERCTQFWHVSSSSILFIDSKGAHSSLKFHFDYLFHRVSWENVENCNSSRQQVYFKCVCLSFWIPSNEIIYHCVASSYLRYQLFCFGIFSLLLYRCLSFHKILPLARYITST